MEKKKFTGKLGEKISLDEHKKRLIAYLRNDDEEIRALNNINYEKLELLIKHYGIKESNIKHIHLLLALAHDFVPAFQVETKAGADRKWTFSIRADLYNRVVELMRGPPPRKIVPACKILADEEPWKSFLESKDSTDTFPDPGEALRQQYYYYKHDLEALFKVEKNTNSK